MRIQDIILALSNSVRHRIATIQTLTSVYIDREIESVDPETNTIWIWADVGLVPIHGNGIVALHISDMEADPFTWVDEARVVFTPASVAA